MIKKKIVWGIIAIILFGGCIGANTYNKYKIKKYQEHIVQQEIKTQKLKKANTEDLDNEKKVETQKIEEPKNLTDENKKNENVNKDVEKSPKKNIGNKKVEAKKENISKAENKEEPIKNSESRSQTINEKKENYTKPGKIGYVYLEGDGATEELANLTNTYLSYVPKNIMDNFVANGWKVVLTDKNIAKTYYHDTSLGKIVGLTVSEAKTIYILASKNAIKSSTIHEIGHFIDIQRDIPSNSKEFLTDFDNEKDTFEVYSFDGHYKTNHLEFFAEVFQESILNPDRCKKTASKSYEFVKRQVNLIS